MPWPKGIKERRQHDQLADLALPPAQRMWTDLQNPDRGRVKFKHDRYLKMWALQEPVIQQDFLLDEAQDTDEPMSDFSALMGSDTRAPANEGRYMNLGPHGRGAVLL